MSTRQIGNNTFMIDDDYGNEVAKVQFFNIAADLRESAQEHAVNLFQEALQNELEFQAKVEGGYFDWVDEGD